MLSRSDPFDRFLPWTSATGLIVFVGVLFIPLHTKADQPSASRIAFEGQTTKSLEEVSYCLGQDWGHRLTLRPRKAPSSNITRLTNPVWHYTVDVIDQGPIRKLRAYSRRGGPFRQREIEAIDGCLTGAAPALANPRKR
jgi:hypothetical protein